MTATMRSHSLQARNGLRGRGFTLIELLVVMAVLAVLLSLAGPRYVEHIDRSREAVLRHNLRGLREAIDKFYTDRNRYPKDLQELVAERYLRQLPLDPVTDRADTWVVMGPSGQAGTSVAEVRSGSTAMAKDGTRYGTW